MAQVTRIPAPGASIDDVLVAVVACWCESAELSEQSTGRMVELADRFVGFAGRAGGCVTLADVDAGVVAGFVSAAGTTGPPATATQHLRRSAVRLLFRTARQLGFTDQDPTMDLVLAPRSSLKARPLDDIEMEICRSYAQSTLAETRLPAAWALAEATARTSDLPHLRICDVDLDGSRVWGWGSPRCEPR